MQIRPLAIEGAWEITPRQFRDDRGVFLAPSSYEVMFVSLAHSDEDLARTVELAAEAAASL